MKKMTKKIIASALAAAMVMASGVMTFADEAATGYEELTKCNYDAKMTVKDKVATVTISLSGDCSAFDFGLMYDADTMEYDIWEVTDEFDKAFSKKAQGITTVNDQKDQSYVVFAGAGDDCTFEGDALVVTFNIKGDEATPISVVKDSKYILDAYKAATATGTLADFLASDKAPADAPKAVEAEVPAPEEPTTPPVEPTPDNNNNNNNNNNGGNTDNNTTNNNNASNNNAAPTTTTAAPATTTAAASKKVKSPKTGDAGVVLPIVAICGAAAAVAVASKKKVED